MGTLTACHFSGRGGSGLGVVDGVGFVEAEADGGKGEAAVGGSPVEPAFEAPTGFGLERGIADGGGVGVVEIDVGGLAEAVAGGAAQAEGLGEREGRGDRGREDGALAGENFFARSEGEREAAERAQAEVGVAGALVARVQAEGVAERRLRRS